MDKVKVLVVEDEWVTAKDIKRSLEALNYAVPATVATGEEAIQKAIELQPNLVLMDIVLLGELDGIEAAEQIHQSCNIPIVFLTAYSDSETLQRANATQPYGYLLKPFEDRELNTTIQIALSRHKATVELRSQLAAIVESSEDAIIGKTLDGIIATWNSGAQKLFGYSAKEAIGRSISILLPPNYADEMPKILARIRRGEIVDHYETVRMRKDGQLIDVFLSISPIRDATGQVIGASKIARDITQHKQNERIIQEQQSLLRSLIEGSTDLIAALDLHFRYITFNSAYKAEFYKIFGQEIEIGTSLIEALAHLPDEQAKAMETWGRALAGEEFTVIQELGDIARKRNYYEITYSSIRDENGQQIGASHIVKDVSDRIRSEQALRDSEERFRNAFDYSAIGMGLVALDGYFLKVNRSYCEITGYSEAEMLATTFQSITHPDDLERDLTYVRQLLSGEISSYYLEKRYIHKQGHIVWVFLSGSLVGDERGQPLYFIAQVQDITERKQAEEALRRSKAHLAEAQKIAHVGSWEFDLTTQKIRWSEELFRIYGFDSQRKEPTYSEHLQQFFPEDRAVLEKSIDTALRAGKPYQFDYQWLRPDGSLRYLAVTGKPLFNEKGDVIQLLGTVLDITDRKQAELELIRSKDLKQAIFNESTDAIFLVDSETLLTFDCNKRAVELFKAKCKDELMGIAVHSLQRQPFTPQELVAITQEVSINGVWSREIEYITKQGNLFWGNLAAKRINIADGAIHLVRVTDITERKEVERELEFQAVIARNMAEGICLVRTADWTIVYANPKFETLFGYDMGELSDKPVSILNYSNKNTTAEDTVRHIVHDISNYGVANCEVHNIKKDGTPFWCQATISQFGHPDYGMVYVAVQHDITEQKQAQEQIKASLKEKEVLLKEIHHRVKNNLQIVKSLLQMQARRTKEQEATLVLQDSQNRITSIALVHEKLYRSDDLANIDFAQYIPDLTTHLFDTYNVSSNTVSLNIEVDNIFLEIDTAIPCGLIINELVSNSLKYAFPNNRKGEIQVRFHANSHETMTLIVSDNGIGIPEEFDLENTQSLGMTLVQGLVDQLDGAIDLNRSRGTEFRMTFPRSYA